MLHNLQVSLPVSFLGLCISVLCACSTTAPIFPAKQLPNCSENPASAEQTLADLAHHGDAVIADYLVQNSVSFRKSFRQLQSTTTKATHAGVERKSRLLHEIGDRFPSIQFYSSDKPTSKLRLDPPLRKKRVTHIEKIAISPDEMHVAVIVRAPQIQHPWIMLINRDGRITDSVLHDAYDLIWITNETLLVSNGRPQPNATFLLERGHLKRPLLQASNFNSALILARDPAGDFFSIEERSSSYNALTLFNSQYPHKSIITINSSNPGNRCVSFQTSIVCISFASNPYGDLISFRTSSAQHIKTLKRGSASSFFEDLDADENNLVAFLRNHNRSALSIYTSLGREPIEVSAPTPLSTFKRAPRGGVARKIAVTLHSPVNTSVVVPLSKVQDPADRTTLSSSTCDHCSQQTTVSVSLDGTHVPISLVTPPSPRGLVVIAYGAYGVSLVPQYRRQIEALLRNGIAVGYAHVRGGNIRGHPWHQAGRGSLKIKALEDLQSATSHLQRHLKIKASATVGLGTSAGGWLFLQTARKTPQLFGGLILDAPLIRPGDSNQSPRFQGIDDQEWKNTPPSLLDTSISDDMAKHFPRILANIPLQDEVVPASRTLRWLQKLSCRKERSYQDFWLIDYKGKHSSSSSSLHTHRWQALQLMFVESLVYDSIHSRNQTGRMPNTSR
jgi:alpha-beta hydrolase superfamily lysophospholipase